MKTFVWSDEYNTGASLIDEQHHRLVDLFNRLSESLTEKSGYYKENPGTDVAPAQMIRKTTDKSRGIRLGNYVQIRTIEDEELEQVWGGKKTAKEALDSMVMRGNELLERFEKANK